MQNHASNLFWFPFYTDQRFERSRSKMSHAPVDKEIVFVPPGSVVVAEGALILRTLVGGGMCVTVWNDTAMVGGMNHFLEPHAYGGLSIGGSYGDSAMRELIQAMCSRCSDCRFNAAVYGGAGQTIPEKERAEDNLAQAMLVLERAGIPVRTTSVGGAGTREITFDLTAGVVRAEWATAE